MRSPSRPRLSPRREPIPDASDKTQTAPGPPRLTGRPRPRWRKSAGRARRSCGRWHAKPQAGKPCLQGAGKTTGDLCGPSERPGIQESTGTSSRKLLERNIRHWSASESRCDFVKCRRTEGLFESSIFRSAHDSRATSGRPSRSSSPAPDPTTCPRRPRPSPVSEYSWPTSPRAVEACPLLPGAGAEKQM